MEIAEGGAQARPADVRALTLVISAPRTGSTLLCRDLASLGGLGSPREYFRGFETQVKAGTATEVEVLARLAQGVQPESPGVGAVKLMVQQARAVAQALTGRRTESSAEAVSAVVRWAHERFDHVMVVLLVRNTLDQAISRAVAEATGVYHSTGRKFRAGGEVPIEGVDINQLILAELAPAARDRVTLQKIAKMHEDTALLLTYDDLTARPEATAALLVEHARSHGLEPLRTTPTRRLTKVISAERADGLRQGFLEFLTTEPGH